MTIEDWHVFSLKWVAAFCGAQQRDGSPNRGLSSPVANNVKVDRLLRTCEKQVPPTIGSTVPVFISV